MSEKRTLWDVLHDHQAGCAEEGGVITTITAHNRIADDIMACVPADIDKHRDCGKQTTGECGECLHCVRHMAHNAALAEVRANIKRYTEGK